MAFLNLHGVSEGRVSIACLLISPCGSCFLYHARSCKKNSSTFQKLPEACQKVSGRRQGICGPGPVWLMLLWAISVPVPDIFLGGLVAKKFTYRKPGASCFGPMHYLLPKLMFAYRSFCDYHISEKGLTYHLTYTSQVSLTCDRLTL